MESRMTTPNALASLALTVNLIINLVGSNWVLTPNHALANSGGAGGIRGRVTSIRDLVVRHQLAEIEDHDEFLALAADAGGIVGLPFSADLGDRLDRLLVDVGDLEHAVGDEADADQAVLHRHVEDDDAGRFGGRHARQAQLGPEVDDRIAAAAHVNHAEQEVRRMRQARDRPHVEDFANVTDADAERLAGEPERQILRGCGHDAVQGFRVYE